MGEALCNNKTSWYTTTKKALPQLWKQQEITAHKHIVLEWSAWMGVVALFKRQHLPLEPSLQQVCVKVTAAELLYLQTQGLHTGQQMIGSKRKYKKADIQICA